MPVGDVDTEPISTEAGGDVGGGAGTDKRIENEPPLMIGVAAAARLLVEVEGPAASAAQLAGASGQDGPFDETLGERG